MFYKSIGFFGVLPHRVGAQVALIWLIWNKALEKKLSAIRAHLHGTLNVNQKEVSTRPKGRGYQDDIDQREEEAGRH